MAWRLYLTATYCTMAWLCAWLRPAWVAWSGAGIFVSQALDELAGGNLWAMGLWEYPLAAVFSLAVYLITRRSDDDQGRP